MRKNNTIKEMKTVLPVAVILILNVILGVAYWGFSFSLFGGLVEQLEKIGIWLTPNLAPVFATSMFGLTLLNKYFYFKN